MLKVESPYNDTEDDLATGIIVLSPIIEMQSPQYSTMSTTVLSTHSHFDESSNASYFHAMSDDEFEEEDIEDDESYAGELCETIIESPTVKPRKKRKRASKTSKTPGEFRFTNFD